MKIKQQYLSMPKSIKNNCTNNQIQIYQLQQLLMNTSFIMYKIYKFYNLILKMNKKLQSIKNLKTKIYNIQNQLNKIITEDLNLSLQDHHINNIQHHKQYQNCTHQQQKIKNHLAKSSTFKNKQNQDKQTYAKKSNILPFNQNQQRYYNSSHNKLYRNPTFWNGNPILGTDNQIKKPITKKSRLRQNRSRSKQLLNPNLQNLMKEVAASYYSISPQRSQQNLSAKKSVSNKSPQFMEDKHSQKSSQTRRQTPRFQKIRTYEKQMRNPILFPDAQKQKGHKIVHKINKSPENYFTNNPQSSPLLYFNHNQPVYLSSTKNHHNNKNVSKNIEKILSSSLEDLHKTKNSNEYTGKKHYAKYFKDNFFTKWQ